MKTETMTTASLMTALENSQARELYLESQNMPTSEIHAIVATIKMELSDRLGVAV